MPRRMNPNITNPKTAISVREREKLETEILKRKPRRMAKKDAIDIYEEISEDTGISIPRKVFPNQLSRALKIFPAAVKAVNALNVSKKNEVSNEDLKHLSETAYLEIRELKLLYREDPEDMWRSLSAPHQNGKEKIERIKNIMKKLHEDNTETLQAIDEVMGKICSPKTIRTHYKRKSGAEK